LKAFAVAAAAAALALLLIPHAFAQGKIRLLLIGDVTLGESPIQEWLKDDPAMTFEIVPCNVENIPIQDQYRAARIYTPRTEDDFSSRFDMMVMLDTNLAFFTDKQIHLFYVMVVEHGMGIFHTPNQHKGHPVYDLFASTDLGKVFPHDYSKDLRWPIEQPYRIVVNRDPSLEPVLTPFLDYGIENVVGGKYGELYARPGSTTWATMIPQNLPWQISWEYGEKKARTWCNAEDVDDPWWNVINNPYGADVFLNEVLYIARRKLATDIPTVHKLRNDFKEYRTRRGIIYGILDFADKFGANPARVEKEIIAVDAIRNQAFESYTAQDFTASIEYMEKALDGLEKAAADAMRLKDRALFWIYLVEWLSVTGTSILAGSLLWMLMVRRALFKQVVTTRSAEE